MSTKVLSVASGGGHWEQLMLVSPAFEGCETHYATTIEGLPERAGVSHWSIVPDCNRNELLQTLKCATRLLGLIATFRPTVVVTTGALPGLLAIMIARRFGARTVWIDSVANAEELSLSGMRARRYADLWLTQWEHVAEISGAEFEGRVL